MAKCLQESAGLTSYILSWLLPMPVGDEGLAGQDSVEKLPGQASVGEREFRLVDPSPWFLMRRLVPPPSCNL